MIGRSNLDFSPYPSASSRWVRDVKVTYFPAHLSISDRRSNFWEEWVQFESQDRKLPRIFYTQKQTSMFHYAIKSKHKQFNFHIFFPFCLKSFTAAQVLLNNPFHSVSNLSSQGSSVFHDHCMTELNKIQQFQLVSCWADHVSSLSVAKFQSLEPHWKKQFCQILFFPFHFRIGYKWIEASLRGIWLQVIELPCT